MSEEKADDNKSEKWEVLYWKLRNRGNWIRYMFEEAKVEYIDHSVTYKGDNKAYSKFLMEHFKAFGDGTSNPCNDTYPALAPPAIRKGKFFLNQSEVVINYLSEELNLLPINENDKNNEKLQRLRCKQLLSNCNDIIREIYSLKGKDKDKDVIPFFEGGRFQKWLNVIETPLPKDNKDKDEIYYFNDKCCYIDLIVFNLMEGLQDFLGKKFDSYLKDHQTLLKHFKCIGKRDCIQNLLKKQKEELKFKWFAGKAFDKIAEDMQFV